MKKILDSNWFIVPLVVVQAVCLSIEIYAAVNDDNYTSAALLFLGIPCLFLFSLILMITALIVKNTKRWLYVALTMVWVLTATQLFKYIDLEDLEEVRLEHKQSEMTANTINKAIVRIL